jgi:hypothetical protein
MTQTPGENAGSRSRRPHYKDRFVYSILRFNVIVACSLSVGSSDFLAQRDSSYMSQQSLHPGNGEWRWLGLGSDARLSCHWQSCAGLLKLVNHA